MIRESLKLPVIWIKSHTVAWNNIRRTTWKVGRIGVIRTNGNMINTLYEAGHFYFLHKNMSEFAIENEFFTQKLIQQKNAILDCK